MPARGQTKANAKPRTRKERAYDATPARKKARAERNKQRRKAIREGRASVGDGTVVNHKKSIKKHGLSAAKKGGTNIQSKRASNKQGAKIRNGRNRITKPRKK